MSFTISLGGTSGALRLDVPPLMPNIVAEGDSLTAGGHADEVVWVTQLGTLEPTWTIHNAATGGHTLAGDIDTIGQRNAVNALYDAGKTHNVLVVWALANDLYADALEVSELIDIVETYAANMKAVHPDWVIVLCTMLARPWDGTRETIRTTFNAAVVSSLPAGVDAVADVSAVIVDYTTNPGFYADDDIHLNTTGQAAVTAVNRAAIIAALS